MMDWIVDLFVSGSVAQTILILCIISVAGVALSKIRIGSFSFGGGCVFLVAIAAGHFAGKLGIQTNESMLSFAKNFGLVIFVYTLGLQVGPGFFPSLRKGGLRFNLCAIGVIVLGSVGAVLLALFTGTSGPEAVGLLSGATTNTPSLISAQQAVLDLDPSAIQASNSVASAYAVAYPFSILAVIAMVAVFGKMFKKSAAACMDDSPEASTGVFEVRVINPDVVGKTVKEIVKGSGFHFVISRVWREGTVQIPFSDTIIKEGDHLLLICNPHEQHKFGEIFGIEEETDWNRPDINWDIIDNTLVSRNLIVTNTEITGKRIKELKLRNKFGANITRINRAGITMLPSADTRLQFGDRLTVVGVDSKIKLVGELVGNEEKRLDDPNIIPLLAGITLGVLLGSVPFLIPGTSTIVRLGIAGGPIIMGILMGAFGPRFNIPVFTTRGANLMLRQLGITFFFACLGFSVGGNFVDTVFCIQGLKWAGFGILLTVIPLLIVGILNEKMLKMDFAHNMGLLCGVMTNPNALAYTNSMLGNEKAAEAYATVYPFTIFLRVFVAQILITALM